MTMNLTVRPGADRPGVLWCPLLAVVGLRARPRPVGLQPILGDERCAGARAIDVDGRAASPAGSTYTLMQMNLCLSGLAGCYGKVAYPAGGGGGGGPDP